MRPCIRRIFGFGIIMTMTALVCAGCRTAVDPRVKTTAKSTLTSGSHLESSDPELRDSLLRVALAPTARHHRQVAAAYLRLEIRDKAYDHLRTATIRDPKDPAAHDALARLWRDWGFPEHGLTDAQRAVKYAPRSPVAHNTLGTVYEAMGLRQKARDEYWRAVELDTDADYAVANLTRLLAVRQTEARHSPKKERP